jgi:RND family efflux transporter MFP subunit
MKHSINLILLALFIAACSDNGNKKLEELTKREGELKAELLGIQAEIKKLQGDSVKKTNLVSTEQLTPQIFKTYINVQAHVDADENVSLAAEMPGTVTKINVEVGQEVKKGTVLAETDSRVIQQSLADLQVNAELVNQLYEKQKALWDQKIGTEVQFLAAKTNKESMDKKLATLQEQLRMTKIVSPIDGTVDAIDVKLGQLTAPGMPAIRIINFSNLKLKSDLAESYISKVHKGDQVLVYFPDLKDSLTAKVNYAARAINPISRTFNVEINLDNKKEYHPNQIAQIKINDYTSATPVIVLPVKYIQTDFNGKPFVLVNENNKATKRNVKKGKEYNSFVEVLEGISAADELITNGFENVNEGDDLKINNSKVN